MITIVMYFCRNTENTIPSKSRGIKKYKKAPGVEECLNLWQTFFFNVGVKNAIFCLYADLLEAQTFFNITKALLALSIFAVTSLSTCLSITLPMKTKLGFHLFDGLFTHSDWCVGSDVDLHHLWVFFLLILSPVSNDVVSRRVVLSCIWE
jgi:hypothetical protein